MAARPLVHNATPEYLHQRLTSAPSAMPNDQSNKDGIIVNPLSTGNSLKHAGPIREGMRRDKQPTGSANTANKNGLRGGGRNHRARAPAWLWIKKRKGPARAWSETRDARLRSGRPHGHGEDGVRWMSAATNCTDRGVA